MGRGSEYMVRTCGYLLAGLLLLLPVSCAMPQQGGGMSSLMGVKRGQQAPSDQPPPDQQPPQDQQPSQENRK